MAFWCRVKQSRLTNPLHQIRRSNFHSTTPLPSPNPIVMNSTGILGGIGVGIRDWRISRRPSEFCDNSRFFAAPVQPKPKEEKDKMGPRLNEKITGDVVRLVISEDEHLVLSLKEAFQRAQRLGMDLVEVNRKSDPPVVKIMDFHEEKYVKKLKEKENSKTKTKLKTEGCKEIRLTPKIEQKDLEMKAKNAIRSMESGYRVKCTVSGKETEDIGGTLARLCALFEDAAIVESGPRVDRKQAYIVVRHAKFGPSKSGGGKKVSQIAGDAFTNLDPAVVEDEDSLEQESNQNPTRAYKDLDNSKTTTSESGSPESRRPKQSPLPPPLPHQPKPSVVSEDNKKNNSKDSLDPPNHPPNKHVGFPSVTFPGPDNTQVRSPWPSKENPRWQQQRQPIREPPKPSSSFGVFSGGKSNTKDRRQESEHRPQSDSRPPTNTSSKNHIPEKTFGIFSKK